MASGQEYRPDDGAKRYSFTIWQSRLQNMNNMGNYYITLMLYVHMQIHTHTHTHMQAIKHAHVQYGTYFHSL